LAIIAIRYRVPCPAVKKIVWRVRSSK